MTLELFDRYDIRARICAFIFILSPFILDAYLFVDAVRNFSTTVIITVVLIASCGLFTSLIRYFGNRKKQRDYIAEFLSPESTEFKQISKTRYYAKISAVEPEFAGMLCPDGSIDLTVLDDVS